MEAPPLQEYPVSSPADRRLLPWAVLPPVVVLLVVALASRMLDVSAARLLRDPTAIMEAHPLTGMVSSLGIVVWAATVAVLGFSATLLMYVNDGRRAARFLGMGAALTGILMADDLFQFHEYMFAAQLGLPEILVFGVYALSIGGIVYVFSAEVRSSQTTLLAAAIGCFATSIVADAVLDQGVDWTFWIEDGFKFVGITCWFAYFANTSFVAVSSHFRPR